MPDCGESCNIRLASIRRLAGVGLLLLMAAAYSALAASEFLVSRSGEFRVHYSSQLDPLVINQMHNAVLQLETHAGAAVAGARIRVDGGMPAHNHGLPTRPAVTLYLGEGRYLIEGLRFHMHGAWELLITLEVDGIQDTVLIPLQL